VLAGSGVKAGGLTGASFFISPGTRKVAGETLPPAFMPLQPETASGKTTSIASHRNFQQNLTCRV
jgi:hypothetical protein